MVSIRSLPHRQFGLLILVFVLGMGSLLAIQKLQANTAACEKSFHLLNSDAVCNGQRKVSEWDYEGIREALVQKIEEIAASGKVPHIALYFRDLKNGQRFAVREKEQFSPVSLLKLPIMMVILHEAERNPALLDERLTFEKEYGKDFITGEEDESLQLHQSYTIRELLEKMIRYSDNNSSYLLLEKINTFGLQERSNAFSDLGTMNLLLKGELDNVRLISFVNIFVALYNGNYLSPEDSQFALELLAQTNFDGGIVAGVPDSVRVAHKFGIRFGMNDEYGIKYNATEKSELHDCGIVYHAKAPYVLCVLTAGASIEDASAAIATISTMTYEEIDRMWEER